MGRLKGGEAHKTNILLHFFVLLTDFGQHGEVTPMSAFVFLLEE